jgi:hypothetical protein
MVLAPSPTEIGSYLNIESKASIDKAESNSK